MPMSSEAALAPDAYRNALPSIGDILRGSMSGRELIGEGYGDDVTLALDLQCSAAAPVMRDGAYRNEAQ